jgi:peptidoglycan/LPS O-acetylase OafA/YrhL
LLVFLRHEQALTTFWHRWRLPFDVGFVGVGFFFLLSGFVLAFSARTGSSDGAFYRRRFARIYPSHVVTWVLAFGVVAIIGAPSTPFTAPLTLLLLQAWVPVQTVFFGMNGPSWSLSAEIAFYAAFPAVHRLLSRRTRRARWAIGLGAVCACQVVAAGISAFAPTSADLAGYANPLVRGGEFMLGMVLGMEVRAGWRPRIGRPEVLAFAVVPLSVMAWVWHAGGTHTRYGALDAAMVAPFALAILWYAMRDLDGRPSVMRSPTAVYLGRLSFCFYLTHVLVAMLTMHYLGMPGAVGGAVARFVADLVLAIVAAAVVHHLVEVPAERRILARARRRVRPIFEPAPVPVRVEVAA